LLSKFPELTKNYLLSYLIGDFFMTEAFFSPRENIAPVKKIAVVGATYSRPNNGGAIFSQTVIVNKSPGANFSCSACMKKSPPFARDDFRRKAMAN